MNYYKVLLCFFATMACSHDPDQVKEIDTNIIHAGSAGQSEIGVNKKNKMLIQTQKELDDELRNAIWLNSQRIFEIKYLNSRLQSCRIQKREKMTEELFPAISLSLIDEVENGDEGENEELGINSKGEYKLVTKESYTKRLNSERNLKKQLGVLKQKIKTQLTECEYLDD